MNNTNGMIERRIHFLSVACLVFGLSLLAPSPSRTAVEAFAIGQPRSRSSAVSATPTFESKTRIGEHDPKHVPNSERTVVVAGATGYIGRAVVQESVKRGHPTVAIVRDLSKLETREGQAAYRDCFRGATVVECDVQDEEALQNTLSSLQSPKVDTVVSCLASPIGTKKDAYAIDYQATLNCLRVGQRLEARHFVLLSAFCCRNPLLQLQRAKLKFEAELQAQKDLTYSIVRPTAFFKSVSGQLEAIQNGAPYVLFDDGAVTRCNPIAESELAEYMMNTLVQQDLQNRILNVGGPDEPLTNKNLGEVRGRHCGGVPVDRSRSILRTCLSCLVLVSCR